MVIEYNDKQLRILHISEKLFAKNGYEGTSVRGIAEDAGVNIAMISYYFGSKEKLLEALFEQRTKHIKLTVEALLDDDSISPIKKMEALADDYLDRVMGKLQFYKIMICEQVINKNPVIVHLIQDMKKKNIEEISRLVKQGQQKKVFKKDVDVLLLMHTLTGTITQMMIGLDFYKEYHNLLALKKEVAYALVRQRMSDHLKFLFKALLTNEA